MTIEERLTARIAELKTERDQFVMQANQTIAAYNAAISELEKMLEPPKPEENKQDDV